MRRNPDRLPDIRSKLARPVLHRRNPGRRQNNLRRIRGLGANDLSRLAAVAAGGILDLEAELRGRNVLADLAPAPGALVAAALARPAEFRPGLGSLLGAGLPGLGPPAVSPTGARMSSSHSHSGHAGSVSKTAVRASTPPSTFTIVDGNSVILDHAAPSERTLQHTLTLPLSNNTWRRHRAAIVGRSPERRDHWIFLN